MKTEDFRIFISYRENDASKDFAQKLYNAIRKEKDSELQYGLPYFSEAVALDYNYREDISTVMQNIEYFVIPYTEHYFDDFTGSVTDEEIKAALERSDYITFLRVQITDKKFADKPADEMLLRRLYKEKADKLICLKDITYSERCKITDINKILNVLRKQDYSVTPVTELIQKQCPNVHLTFKKETEDNNKIPFYRRLYNIKKLSLLNFAGTSFISSINISTAYKKSDIMQKWFEENLTNGNIEANVIINNPHSYAASDAALYKMNPGGQNATPKDEIILLNLNQIIKFKSEYPKSNLSVYTTDIALPYGIMLAEHDNADEDFIKVDLYAPCVEDDKRPSFYLLRKNGATREIYNFFEDNLKFIMNHKAKLCKEHRPIDFLQKKIIHRGRISSSAAEHTYDAFNECIRKELPMEVDLLFLSDGEILVYRDMVLSNGQKLSDLGYSDILFGDFQELPAKQIMLFENFLKLVNGRVPLLIEIKSNDYNEEQAENQAAKIFKRLRNYKGDYAVHSANPYVLRAIRELDVQIPLGQITLDFSRKEYENADDFTKQVHRECNFLKVFEPDFISYNIKDLRNTLNGSRKSVVNAVEKLNIPMLLWTVKSQADEEYAQSKNCAMVIEGAVTFCQ